MKFKTSDLIEVHSFGYWYDGLVLSVGPKNYKIRYTTGTGTTREKAFRPDLVRAREGKPRSNKAPRQRTQRWYDMERRRREEKRPVSDRAELLQKPSIRRIKVTMKPEMYGDGTTKYDDGSVRSPLELRGTNGKRYYLAGSLEPCRREFEGPILPGPYYFMNEHCIALTANPEHGTWGDMRRAEAAGLVREIAIGDELDIDGLIHVIYQYGVGRSGNWVIREKDKLTKHG
jgi:hypothetical protein